MFLRATNAGPGQFNKLRAGTRVGDTGSRNSCEGNRTDREGVLAGFAHWTSKLPSSGDYTKEAS